MSLCVYCSKEASDNCLRCEECNQKVHVGCLKNGGVPGGLQGDVFFKLVCQNCSLWGQEDLTREKMPWISLIVLTLYNLNLRSSGVSRQGYFHWKMHICNFIERHWNVLFGSAVRKKRSWMGTVSGTLSHYSPTYFRSGSEELRESGWWRLAVNATPEVLMQQHAQMSVEKKNKVKPKQQDAVSSSSWLSCIEGNRPAAPDDSSLSAFDDTSSIAESEHSGRVSAVDTNSSIYSTWSSFKSSNNMYSRAYVEPSETLSDCLFADEEEECSDIDVDIEGVDISCSQGPDLGDLLPTPELADSLTVELPAVKVEPQEQDPLSLEVKQEACESGVEENGSEGDIKPSSKPAAASLFTVVKSTDHLACLQDCYDNSSSRCVPMSEYEELQLLNQLRRVPTMSDVPGAVRRLYRKLSVRRLKRERGMVPFNLDKTQTSRERTVATCAADNVRVLDRFQRGPVATLQDTSSRSFIMRLMGQSEPECFYSPYTHRLLKPYIRRDPEATPLWLRLLDELQMKANRHNADWRPSPRHPIDYSYVRPHHISSINSLCREFFYPGIDLTECLQYPDFSCVVLYKKLVVGFAFMVPDVGLNEAYISFMFTRPEWRRAGLATFMLYHLIQTCMGKDLTLHVSVTNPALMLYQKFGFKVEELVQDFYEKYFPADCKECKHALFLRLSR